MTEYKRNGYYYIIFILAWNGVVICVFYQVLVWIEVRFVDKISMQKASPIFF
jgi:hypothetical protein